MPRRVPSQTTGTPRSSRPRDGQRREYVTAGTARHDQDGRAGSADLPRLRLGGRLHSVMDRSSSPMAAQQTSSELPPKLTSGSVSPLVGSMPMLTPMLIERPAAPSQMPIPKRRQPAKMCPRRQRARHGQCTPDHQREEATRARRRRTARTPRPARRTRSRCAPPAGRTASARCRPARRRTTRRGRSRSATG